MFPDIIGVPPDPIISFEDGAGVDWRDEQAARITAITTTMGIVLRFTLSSWGEQTISRTERVYQTNLVRLTAIPPIIG
jgi:hypothetical protein